MPLTASVNVIIPGRFAGAVAKRLASLGALLQGDRRALGASSSLKSYDIDNKWGIKALDRLYQDLQSGGDPMPGVVLQDAPWNSKQALQASVVGDHSLKTQEFYSHMRKVLSLSGLGQVQSPQWPGGSESFSVDPKICKDIPRFLNRLLGMPLTDQKLLFDYFCATLEATIKRARSQGHYESGIEVLSDMCHVSVVKEQVIHTDSSTGATTSFVELQVDDGLNWEAALAIKAECQERLRQEGVSEVRVNKVGFYVFARTNNYGGTGHPLVVLATEVPELFANKRFQSYSVRRPNQCRSNLFKGLDLVDRYKLCSEEEARVHWNFWFDFLKANCLHGLQCKRRNTGGDCMFGSRLSRKRLITGAVLPIMSTIFEHVTQSQANSGRDKRPPRALRAKVEDGRLLVGLSLSPWEADLIMQHLTS